MTRIFIRFGILFLFVLFVQGNTKPKYSMVLTENVEEARSILSSYNSLIDTNRISGEAFIIAFKGFMSMLDSNTFSNDSLLTIVDFSKPSNEERLFVLDVKNRKLLQKSLVAHGQRSGVVYAEEFSNQGRSHKSSLGFYKTSKTYTGKHGYSMLLEGLDESLNSNAMDRAIVVHGANYVSENYIKQNGRIGRSFGCPALPFEQTEQIIDLIKNGSCFFIYHPSLNASYSFFQ